MKPLSTGSAGPPQGRLHARRLPPTRQPLGETHSDGQRAKQYPFPILAMTDLAPLPFYRFLDRLDIVLRGAGIAPVSASLGVSPRIRRVQDFVEVRVGEALCLDDLAEVAGLSRYHFSRVFREETGQTPWAFVRDARIERAKELLSEGASPTEAAHEAGFFDQSHLTRVLRRFDGRTPGQVRDGTQPPPDASVEASEDAGASDSKIVQDS